MLTIFTPTYNRAYILPVLYRSLQLQTCKDFEWLIIDDGSTDNTQSLIQAWIDDPANTLDIRYFRQPNGGKHRAINYGVQHARGELFFIVDSDDYLFPDTVSLLLQWWNEIKDKDGYAGICGLRCDPSGNPLGGIPSYTNYIDTDCLTFRTRYHEKGDKAEAFRTEILKKYPFPEFENERFVTEALVWNRIAQEYILRYHNRNIYCCDYLPDGLTRSIARHHFASPQGTALYYSELAHWPQTDRWNRIKAVINYWRYSTGNKQRFNIKCRQIGWSNLFLLPLGMLFRLRDKLNDMSRS